ncbi:MAG: TrmH family RNA methyltransferase [Bacteroidia bacterium]
MLQPISKAKLKLFSSLSHKKYRNLSALFIIEGIKLVKESLVSGFEIEAVIVNAKQEKELAQKISFDFFPCEVFSAQESDFYKLSEQVQAEGIIAVIRFPSHWQQKPTISLANTSFLLENVQDPGNLGTILRIADWFGIAQILCSPDTADFLNPKVLRASMGAIFRLNIFYPDRFYEIIEENAGKIWVADMQGTPLPQVHFQANQSLLLGNEAKGISAKIQAIQGLQYVNIPKKGQAESLNVAIASGILAYQMTLNQG